MAKEVLILDMERALVRRALEDEAVMSFLAPRLNAYRFSDANLNWLWHVAIMRNFEATSEPPPQSVLRAEVEELTELAQVPALEQLIAVYKTDPERRYRSVLKILLERRRKELALKGVSDFLAYQEKGDNEGAIKALEKGLTKVDTATGLKVQPLVPANWLTMEKGIEKIPTGLLQLDYAVEGGLGRGEVGLVMGSAGNGKSIMSLTLGYGALRRGFRVLHIDSENGEAVVLARYISRMTGVPAAQIQDRSSLGELQRRRLQNWTDRNYDRLKERVRALYVAYDEFTLGHVEAAIREEYARGFHPDMIVFDSPDHLVMRDKQQRWEQFAELSNRLKGFAQRHKVALWVTSQTAVEFEDKIAGARAVADSKQKVRVASIVLSVNKATDPVTAKPIPGQKVLFVAKSRNSAAHMKIPLVCDLNVMRVTTPLVEHDVA